MNSPLKLQPISNDLSAQQLSCDERVEDYLENLLAPLVGIVPYPERKAFRENAHAHLDGLIREYAAEGQNLAAATETALREFGEPWRVGQIFLEEWLQGTPQLRPPLLVRKATGTAFAWFGIASMLLLLLLEKATFSPAPEILLPAIGLLAFFAPFVAGGLTGGIAPAQAERGVTNTVLLLALHSLITGLLLQPHSEGFVFAGWQLLFWLPVGRISATMTAKYVRQVRRQRFWQIAR